MPTSPEAVLLGKMAYHPKHFCPKCTNLYYPSLKSINFKISIAHNHQLNQYKVMSGEVRLKDLLKVSCIESTEHCFLKNELT